MERDFVIHELLAESQDNLELLRRCVENNKGHLSQMDSLYNVLKSMEIRTFCVI